MLLFTLEFQGYFWWFYGRGFNITGKKKSYKNSNNRSFINRVLSWHLPVIRFSFRSKKGSIGKVSALKILFVLFSFYAPSDRWVNLLLNRRCKNILYSKALLLKFLINLSYRIVITSEIISVDIFCRVHDCLQSIVIWSIFRRNCFKHL